MKSYYDQALECGRSIMGERSRRKIMLLASRYERLCKQLTLDELNRLEGQLRGEFPRLDKYWREKLAKSDQAGRGTIA